MSETDVQTQQAPALEFAVRPVGYVRAAYTRPEDVAHTRHGWTADVSHIQILPRYAGLLGGLTGYSHIIVLFWVHRAKEWKIPKGHRHEKPRHVKVFATRMPVRPNPIGMSVVQLVDFSRETGSVTVKGLDALDGTPVLDIKPYIPNFDSCPDATIPDWVGRHLASHLHSGRPHHHHHEHHGEDAGEGGKKGDEP